MLNSSPAAPFQRLLIATVYGFALLESPAFAQSATSMGAYVQPGGCGTANYPPGIARPITQDNTGTLCTSGAGGGGGGGTVTQGPSGTASWATKVSGGANVTEGTIGDTATAQTIDGYLNGVNSALNGTVTVQTAAGSQGYQTDSAGVDATDTVNHAVKVNVVAGGLGQNSTTAGVSGSLVMGAVTSGTPAYTTAKTSSLSLGPDGGLRIEGPTVTGVAVSGGPVITGGRVAQTWPTAVSDGQAVATMYTSEGRLVTKPYSMGAMDVRGSASALGVLATTIIAASGSFKVYVTAVQCFRTDAGASTAYVTLSDSASSVVGLPAGGGGFITFPTPIVTLATGAALTFTSSTALASAFCNAQGYYSP